MACMTKPKSAEVQGPEVPVPRFLAGRRTCSLRYNATTLRMRVPSYLLDSNSGRLALSAPPVLACACRARETRWCQQTKPANSNEGHGPPPNATATAAGLSPSSLTSTTATLYHPHRTTCLRSCRIAIITLKSHYYRAQHVTR
jgi:hypothetical protein